MALVSTGADGGLACAPRHPAKRRGILAAICTCLAFCLAIALAHAQQDDQARVDSLRKASWALKDSEPSAALHLGRTAYRLAGRIGDAMGQGRALQCMSAAHMNLGQRDSARMELEEALQINERINYRPGVLSCLQKLAMLRTGEGEVKLALDLLDKAEALAMDLGNQEERARTFNLRGAALEMAGRYEEAIAPYFASIEIRKRTGSEALTDSYQNLASLYLHMDRVSEATAVYETMVATGRSRQEPALMADGFLNLAAARSTTGNYGDARNAADSALALFRTTGNVRSVADALVNRSAALAGLGLPGDARTDLDSAMALYRRAGDGEGIASACAGTARLALRQQQPETALVLCDQGLSLARSLDLGAVRAQLLSLRANALQALGRYDEAVATLHAYLALKDSLMGERALAQLADAEMREKYSAVERLAQVEKLRSEKAHEVELRNKRTGERNVLVVISLLLVMLSLLLLRNIQHRRKLARQEQQIHEKRVNELLHENEVQVLNAVLNGQEAERQRVAKDLHDRLGSMLSAVKLQFGALESRMDALHLEHKSAYKKVYDLLDDAVKEVRNISHGMINGALAEFGLATALKSLRDSIAVTGKLEVELSLYGLEHRLERRMEIAVYHMVQELVANALKHARPSELSIALTRSPDRLNILISDNGPGFDPAVITTGMGLNNVRIRAQELGGTVHIDSSPRKGTTVSIEIPLG